MSITVWIILQLMTAPPGQVSTVNITAGPTMFTITWTIPAFLGNLPVSNYTIEISEQINENFAPRYCNGSLDPGRCIVNETMIVITNLIPATNYDIRIIANNAVGSSNPTERQATTDELGIY